jgi:hypothetical protein
LILVAATVGILFSAGITGVAAGLPQSQSFCEQQPANQSQRTVTQLLSLTTLQMTEVIAGESLGEKKAAKIGRLEIVRVAELI